MTNYLTLTSVTPVLLFVLLIDHIPFWSLPTSMYVGKVGWIYPKHAVSLAFYCSKNTHNYIKGI